MNDLGDTLKQTLGATLTMGDIRIIVKGAVAGNSSPSITTAGLWYIPPKLSTHKYLVELVPTPLQIRAPHSISLKSHLAHLRDVDLRNRPYFSISSVGKTRIRSTLASRNGASKRRISCCKSDDRIIICLRGNGAFAAAITFGSGAISSLPDSISYFYHYA